MVVLVGVGQVVTWIVMFRSGKKEDLKKAADEAAKRTAEATGIKELAAANDRIASSLESLDKWTRSHELSDTKWQSAAEEIMKQQTRTNADMARMLENVQRQLSNLALGLAPTEASEVLPNMPRRRR